MSVDDALLALRKDRVWIAWREVNLLGYNNRRKALFAAARALAVGLGITDQEAIDLVVNERKTK